MTGTSQPDVFDRVSDPRATIDDVLHELPCATTLMKIYVASSWRNTYQPAVVGALRAAGHSVYDFRHPHPDEVGFAWSQVDAAWQSWSLADYQRALRHTVARRGFQRDHEALELCDACVLVLPSGASAHIEAGWCAGRGKAVVVYAPELKEPELMYKIFDLAPQSETPIFDDLSAVMAYLHHAGNRA